MLHFFGIMAAIINVILIATGVITNIWIIGIMIFGIIMLLLGALGGDNDDKPRSNRS